MICEEAARSPSLLSIHLSDLNICQEGAFILKVQAIFGFELNSRLTDGSIGLGVPAGPRRNQRKCLKNSLTVKKIFNELMNNAKSGGETSINGVQGSLSFVAEEFQRKTIA